MPTLTINANVYLFLRDDADKARLAAIEAKLDRLLQQGRVTNMKIDEMRQELAEINVATNRQADASTAIAATQTEIAADVDALLANTEGGLTDADIEALKAVKAKAVANAQVAEEQAAFLRTVADKYPTAPTDPPVEG